MAGADLAAVVNPNNPDGQNWSHEIITDLAGKVDQLMVDESFADAETGLSLAPRLKAPSENVIVLRCFGKFFGLAGVRLGFVLAGPKTAALADREWHHSISGQLHADAARLFASLDATAGCPTIGA
jgi:cobalamin biosynthetic protein CobC